MKHTHERCQNFYPSCAKHTHTQAHTRNNSPTARKSVQPVRPESPYKHTHTYTGDTRSRLYDSDFHLRFVVSRHPRGHSARASKSPLCYVRTIYKRARVCVCVRNPYVGAAKSKPGPEGEKKVPAHFETTRVCKGKCAVVARQMQARARGRTNKELHAAWKQLSPIVNRRA